MYHKKIPVKNGIFPTVRKEDAHKTSEHDKMKKKDGRYKPAGGRMENRTRKMSLVLLSLAVLWTAAACSRPVGLPRLEKDDVVVAFGDSITYGVGAAPQESYPAVLERLIGRRVVNAGVSGEVTAAGLARLPEVLEREKPALVILCLGGNDFLRRLDRKQAALNLRAMVRLAREKGASVALLAVPALGLSVAPDPLYRDLASDLITPLEEKTLSDILADRSLKADLIHPNAAGYRRLAEAVRDLLKKSGAIE